TTSLSLQPQNHLFDQVEAASKEQQSVFITGGVNYVIDDPVKMYKEGGQEVMVTRVFDQAFQDLVKEVTPQYEAATILNHRPEIRDKTMAQLQEAAAPYGFKVTNVYIKNIAFSKEYQAA